MLSRVPLVLRSLSLAVSFAAGSAVALELPLPPPGEDIVGQVQVYKQWHQMDPPDAEEKARNDKIASLQGNRNRFIDDPGQVELLITD